MATFLLRNPEKNLSFSTLTDASGTVIFAPFRMGSETKDGELPEHRNIQRLYRPLLFLKRDHQVIEMWECQFRQYCRQNPAIYDFIDAMRPGFFQKHKAKISEDTILEGVVNEEFFGMVEVDQNGGRLISITRL